MRRSIVLNADDGKEVPMQENVDYVVPDTVPAMLVESNMGNTLLKNENFYDWAEFKTYAGQNLNNKTLVFFRNGGIGDLIFPLPSVKAIKEKYPTCKIYACSDNRYKCLFEELDFIEDVLSLPLKLEEIWKKDYYVNFEGLIEGTTAEERKNAEEVNAYELHATRFFVTPENYCPELKVNPSAEAKIVHELAKYKTFKKIVLAFSASVPIRSVSPELYRELIDSVPDNNVKWFITGSPNQQKDIDAFIRTCKFRNKIVNWSKDHKELVETMVLVKNADCVIAPDSGLLHIAGGFGIPVIGLYGAFHSYLRMKHYKNAIGINAMSTCVFARGKFKCCFQHGGGSCFLARKVYERYPPCMSVIKVDALQKSLETLGIITEFKNLEETKK